MIYRITHSLEVLLWIVVIDVCCYCCCLLLLLFVVGGGLRVDECGPEGNNLRTGTNYTLFVTISIILLICKGGMCHIGC